MRVIPAISVQCFSLDRPTGPIQSLSPYVRLLCVCAIAETLLPCGLETSG